MAYIGQVAPSLRQAPRQLVVMHRQRHQLRHHMRRRVCMQT